MAKKRQPKMVNCRYPKCKFLHESTELLKEEATQGGKQKHYYHPDCFHTMQTVNEIRDLFIKEIDPTLTSKQIGTLVSTINNIIFSKKVGVDYLLFTLQYFIKYKPGALKYPAGLHYVIQDKDVKAAWEKEQKQKLREEIREQQKTITVNDEFILDSPESTFEYKPQKPKGFADILG